MRFLGLVKWYNLDKGFGVIATPTGEEVFLHHTQIKVKSLEISVATALIFETEQKKNRTNALNVVSPISFSDFSLALSYINKERYILIDGRPQGDLYMRKYQKGNSVDIIHSVLCQLVKSSSHALILSYFKEFFEDNYIDTNNPEFLEFLPLLFETLNHIKEQSIVDSGRRRRRRRRASINRYRRSEGDNVNDDQSNLNTDSISDKQVYDLVNYFLANIKKELLFEIWKRKLYIYKRKYLTVNPVPVRENSDWFFTFPEDIFLKNNNSLTDADWRMISDMSNKEQIVSGIFTERLSSLNTIDKEKIKGLNDIVYLFRDTDFNKKLIEPFIEKLLQLLLNQVYTIDAVDEITNFQFVMELNLGSQYLNQLIHRFNEQSSKNTLLVLWKKTRYFNPDEQFLNENLTNLSYADFISARNEEFYRTYFKAFLQRIEPKWNAKSFGVLTTLIVETPINIISTVFEDLPLNLRVALWLTFPRIDKHSFQRSYYEFDYLSSHMELDEKEITRCFNNLESIKDTLQLYSLVIEIQNLHSTTSNPSFHFFGYNYKQRESIVTELLSRKKINAFEYMQVALDRIGNEQYFPMASILIQRMISGQILDAEKVIEILEIKRVSKIDKRKLLDSAVTVLPKKNRVQLWFNGLVSNVNLIDVIEEFDAFPLSDQPKLFRKIFLLLRTEQILSVDDFIAQIISLLQKSTINLDVQLALKVIQALNKSSGFPGENVIAETVCTYVDNRHEGLIQINDLFEKCRGRTWVTPDSKRSIWFLNIEGKNFPVTAYNLVNIAGRDYHFDKESMTVELDFMTVNFTWSLKEETTFSKLYDIPKGVTFCDAVKSQYSEDVERHFYWCCNAKCYSPCQYDHIHLEWENYSLRDFIKILKLPFEEDKYYRFVSIVNRANRLLKKLQCNSCKRLLKDVATSEFAFYRVSSFYCTNTSCDKHHEIVYLNHCLNWKCLNIVDNRLSKKCENGWYICDECNHCCSQKVIDNRYNNLLENRAFNTSNPRHILLKHQVENKLGHLEKGMFFDHKTGKPTTRLE